jgi:hypothetical protein
VPVPPPTESLGRLASGHVNPSGPTPTPKGGSSNKPHDAELIEAVAHLAAGRDTQATIAYARLAARSPSNPGYATVAALLERLASADCSDARVSVVTCPEVKR